MSYQVVFNYAKMLSNAKSEKYFNMMNLHLIVDDFVVPLTADKVEVLLDLQETPHSVSICSEIKIAFLVNYSCTQYYVSITSDSKFELSATSEGGKLKFVLETALGETNVKYISNEAKISTKSKLGVKKMEKEEVNQLANENNLFVYKSLGLHICGLLFTFGIYQLFWVYRLTNFTNRARGEEERNPLTKLLLYLFIPFYSIYWTYKTAQRIDIIAKDSGINSDLGTICLILALFIGIVPPILMQDKVNEIVKKTN